MSAKQRTRNSHEVLDNAVELGALVTIAKLLTILADTSRKCAEVLDCLWNGLRGDESTTYLPE